MKNLYVAIIHESIHLAIMPLYIRLLNVVQNFCMHGKVFDFQIQNMMPQSRRMAATICIAIAIYY